MAASLVDMMRNVGTGEKGNRDETERREERWKRDV